MAQINNRARLFFLIAFLNVLLCFSSRAFAQTYNITVTASQGGSVTPSGVVTVEAGASLRVTITPDEGYHILKVDVNGSFEGRENTYTFNNVSADQSIDAYFGHIITLPPLSRIDMWFDYEWGDNIYEIDGVENDEPWRMGVMDGADFTIYLYCNDNYENAGVTIDGAPVGCVEEYSFINVVSDHVVQMETRHYNFIIATVRTGSLSGSISPEGVSEVYDGESMTCTFHPSAGAHVEDIRVDAVSIGAVSSYTFTGVNEQHVIDAYFDFDEKVPVITTHVIMGEGMISPSGSLKVPYGSSQAISFGTTGSDQILNVRVNGTWIGAVNSYTFENVQADQVIEAAFWPINGYNLYPTVMAYANKGGIINPHGTLINASAIPSVYTITPDPCFHIKDVQYDGVSLGPVTCYKVPGAWRISRIEAFFELDADAHLVIVRSNYGGMVRPAGRAAFTDGCGEVGVRDGASQSFGIEPMQSFYHVEDVKIDGVSIGPVRSCTLENVKSDTRIEVVFAVNAGIPVIRSSANIYGKISPNGAFPLDLHSSRNYYIYGNGDSVLEDVRVDGVSVGRVTSYDFKDVISDHTIEAIYKPNPADRQITQTIGKGGLREGTYILRTKSNATIGCDARPDVYYHLEDVRVNGTSVGPVGHFFLYMVYSDYNYAASFALDGNVNTITASAGPNGAISHAGVLPLANGSGYTYTITPDPGYTVKDVKVDGESAGAVTAYVFTNVTSSHTIEAVFGVPSETTITLSLGMTRINEPLAVTAVLYNAGGIPEISKAYLKVTEPVSGKGVNLVYDIQNRTLGSYVLGSPYPGSENAALDNIYACVDASAARAELNADGKTREISWVFSFKEPFAGDKNVEVSCEDAAGAVCATKEARMTVLAAPVAGVINYTGGDDVLMCAENKPDIVALFDAGSISRLYGSYPEAMVVIKKGGAAPDELLADFGQGAGKGMKIRHADGVWEDVFESAPECQYLSPELMIAADTDGDGQDEVVMDFGRDIGVYAYHPEKVSSNFQCLADKCSCKVMTAADVDGDGKDEVIADFGSVGLWRCDIDDETVAWTGILSGCSVENVKGAEIDGDGIDEVVIDLGPIGLYAYFAKYEAQGKQWLGLAAGCNIDDIYTSDYDSDGKQEVLGRFRGYGTWACDNVVYDPAHVLASNTWDNIAPETGDGKLILVSGFVSGDIDGDARTEMFFDFGKKGFGKWMLRRTADAFTYDYVEASINALVGV